MTALPLVLIAGWGHTGEAMLRMQAVLGAPAAQVTSTGELWQNGFGGAAPRSDGLSRYAAGLRDLLAPLGGHAVVVGWSMGSMVAMEAARKYSGLFHRLVIIGGTARFCAGSDAPAGVSASVLRAMVAGLRRAPQKVRAAYYDKVHAPQGGDMAGAASAPQDILRLDRDELIRGLDYLQHMDVRDGLPQLAVPTLVLHGRQDRIVPWQAGEWLSRALPAGRWRCYENYGHALPIQAAAPLAADMRAFLGDNA